MSFLLQPWQLLVVALAGWVNEQQQAVIEFQNAQVEALLQQLGRKRLRLTDDQRRILAVKAQSIGRKALRQLTTIVTPDTLLRWPRSLSWRTTSFPFTDSESGCARLTPIVLHLPAKRQRSTCTTGVNSIAYMRMCHPYNRQKHSHRIDL